MNFRTTLKTLLIFVLGLPLIQAVLFWVSNLFQSMGDESVRSVLGHVNTVIGIFWLLGLVGLIVALALQTLDEPHDPEV